METEKDSSAHLTWAPAAAPEHVLTRDNKQEKLLFYNSAGNIAEPLQSWKYIQKYKAFINNRNINGNQSQQLD